MFWKAVYRLAMLVPVPIEPRVVALVIAADDVPSEPRM